MFNWLRRNAWPEFVADYHERTPRRVDRKTAWADLKFIVLDAETTGFNPDTDRLLSIGLVPVRGGRIHVDERRTHLRLVSAQRRDPPRRRR